MAVVCVKKKRKKKLVTELDVCRRRSQDQYRWMKKLPSCGCINLSLSWPDNKTRCRRTQKIRCSTYAFLFFVPFLAPEAADIFFLWPLLSLGCLEEPSTTRVVTFFVITVAFDTGEGWLVSRCHLCLFTTQHLKLWPQWYSVYVEMQNDGKENSTI